MDGLQCSTFNNLEMKLQAVSESHRMPSLVTMPRDGFEPSDFRAIEEGGA